MCGLGSEGTLKSCPCWNASSQVTKTRKLFYSPKGDKIVLNIQYCQRQIPYQLVAGLHQFSPSTWSGICYPLLTSASIIPTPTVCHKKKIRRYVADTQLKTKKLTHHNTGETLSELPSWGMSEMWTNFILSTWEELLCRRGKARKPSSVETATSSGRWQKMPRKQAQLVAILVRDTESERDGNAGSKAHRILGEADSTKPWNLAQRWNTGCFGCCFAGV